MSKFSEWLVISSAVFAVSCGQQLDMEGERAAVHEFHDACSKAQLAGNVDCFAEDGQWLPPQAPPIKGRDKIGEIVSQAIEDPNFSVSHDIVDIEVSGSGDLAYIHYTYEFTMSGPDGSPVTEHGKAIYVLKKQPQAGWKFLIDIWNTDTPEAGTGPVDLEAEKNAASAVLSKLWSAFKNQDLDLLSQVFAHDPEMIIFGTDAAERWVGFESFMEAEERMFAAFDVEEMSIRDEVVAVHDSGAVAWFSAVLDGVVLTKGESVPVEGIRITGVIAKRNDGWRIVQYHSSVPVEGQNIEY